MAMKKTSSGPGTPRVEYEELGALRRWPGNPKKHDLAFLGQVFKENGFAELPTVDEGTGRLVGGHGRLDKLEEMHDAGEPAPERIVVKGGKWFVPVIRGMTFAKPGKHLLAANRGPELGGWDPGPLSKMLKAMGEDLIGSGFVKEDHAHFLAMATGPTPPSAFPSVDGTLATDFCCPKCSHRWSGDPQAGAKGTNAPKAKPKKKPRK